jgi:hypothetical protein
MTTKLTLTIDASIIAMSKLYAKEKGQSLSQLVENYLKSLSPIAPQKEPIDPSIKKLKGVLKLTKDFDYKKEISKVIVSKYKK